MGDRTRLDISIRPRDEEKLIALLNKLKAGKDLPELANFFDEIEREPDCITCTCYEANYAWSDYLPKLADGGLDFDGSHGPGGTYDGASFLSHKGILYEVQVNSSNRIVVVVDQQGEPDPDSIIRVKEFLEAVREYRKEK